jgi:hypothetical protein
MSNNYLNYFLSYLSIVLYTSRLRSTEETVKKQDTRREREEERREKGATLKYLACSGPATGVRMRLVNSDCGQGQEWD